MMKATECKFGKALKVARINAELSQADVAKAVGVSGISVSKWECDRAVPGIEHGIRLARLYGVSVDDLFCIPTAL